MQLTTVYESLSDILESCNIQFSNISPSDWVQQNRVMSSAESKFKGPFSYNLTPYCREIVDCMQHDHPARVISVMKGAQVGFSTGVIEPAIGWSIAENPCNILFLTGHSDLSEEAMTKIDGLIDSCGIRALIKPTVARARNTKTGDTNTKKEFAGGSLVSGSAGNHKLLRQRSVKVAFIDDFDAAKGKTKESGSTRKMIEQRLAAYYDEMKLYYISTPETRPSNIEDVYLLGDQRKYHVPCPCCGVFIALEWSVEIEGSTEMAGITWKTDENGKLVRESVGYICQSCGDFFKESHKYEMNLAGKWIPTAIPEREGNYSYHLSALYAPPGMYDWEHYVREYLEANPPNANRKEDLHQTFQNLCLGLPYEISAEEIKATELQKNVRSYDIGTIPEKLSIADGNGKIVLLTLGCDLNGKLDDARLDYEIVAYSVNGATYSVAHGSIGTFIPREGENGIDRARWTYQHGMQRSVWPELEKIISAKYLTDTNRSMRIMMTGVDVGYQTTHAWQFINTTNMIVCGLKGQGADKYTAYSRDSKTFKKSLENPNLFLVDVNICKEKLAEMMRLKWNPTLTDVQPAGFMNFPQPANGLYLFDNYFSHFEAEHKKIDKEGCYRWVKKSDVHQNHLYDCRYYANVVKDIFVYKFCIETKIKNGTWSDWCDFAMKSIK